MKLSGAITPHILSSGEIKVKTLVIPIYQRLFVWGEEQIDNLLNDLWNSCFDEQGKNYYLGVITVHEDRHGNWEIVDGQQRLTFLTLLGCMFVRCGNSEANNIWKAFVWEDATRPDPQPRLIFNGRGNDRDDLKNYTKKNSTTFVNAAFERFAERFRLFVRNKEAQLSFFSEYCFRHAAFLVNELPAGYGPEELNLYFEKMNSTGRQLSPLEVVKGKWFSPFAARWNRCLNFDDEFEGHQDNSSPIKLHDVISGIIERKQLDEAPKGEQDKNRGLIKYRLVVEPEVLALHVLLLLHEEGKLPTKPSLEQRGLISTFNTAFQGKGNVFVNDYLAKLEQYRKWIDDNIICMRDDGDGYEYVFRNDQCDENGEFKYDTTEKKCLRQFHAMLFVSSGEKQEWLLEAYRESKNGKEMSLVDLKRLLVRTLREKCPNECNEIERIDVWSDGLLKYGTDNRRWLCLLDYLLWEQVMLSKYGDIDSAFHQLDNNERESIVHYVFRQANRSVEHLHPQTDDKSNNQEKWAQTISDGSSIKDHFGNLALISPGRNSEYSNDSVGGKADRVVQLIAEKRLESIKLLLMLKQCDKSDEKWTPEVAKTHANSMLKMFKAFLSNYG